MFEAARRGELIGPDAGIGCQAGIPVERGNAKPAALGIMRRQQPAR